MRLQLDDRHKKILRYIDQSDANNIPENIQSYLYQFGAVLICGNIERSIEIIILERLSARAHPKVLSFIKSHFARGANLDCNAIAQLLNRFDSEWYRKFVGFFDGRPDVKEGITSCYHIRNSVAHGLTFGIGSKRLRNLLELSREMIDAVVDATK